MNHLRIVFLGTAPFGVPALELLIREGHTIVSVVTAPDKPRGRGQHVTPSPVKECAVRNNIPVLQPPNLKAPDFLEQLRSFHADLQVVIAFRMLPEAVWSMPGLGTINLHASLLPDYRGAAPINWAIIKGEKETGVTTFFIRQEIDTGSIIFREKEPIRPDDTAGTLHDRLMNKGAALTLKTVQAIASGNYSSAPQNTEGKIHAAPKIFRQDCAIDWCHPRDTIINFVRGLAPYPAAWTTIDRKTHRIFRVSKVEGPEDKAGTWSTGGGRHLHVRASDGWLAVDELQPEGGKRMGTDAFLAGHPLHI